MDLISLLRLQAAEQQKAENAAADATEEPAREPTEQPGADASTGEPAAGLLGDDGGAGPDPLGDGGDVPPGQTG